MSTGINVGSAVVLLDKDGTALGTATNPLVMSSGTGTSATQVEGAGAAGAAPAGNPIAVGGVSDGGLTKELLVDSSGRLHVDIGTIAGTAPSAAGKVDVKSADGDLSTLGITTGAAVITDATGTVQQYLRGLVKLIIAKIGITIADGDNATQGVTTGAKVITDANGTLQQYLRGLVYLHITDGSFINIATQTTTVVKSGAGRLKRIIIPTPVANATIKIYDNTSASTPVICDTITLPATLVSDGPITVEFDVAFATGCTVVTAGATMSVTVVYF